MLACAGLQIPKASPPSPAVSWSLNPGGAAAGETPRPGPPRVCAAPRGHLGPGLRVTLSAQQPKGPAGESALSLSGGLLPRGVSSESPSGGFPPRGVSSECPSGGFLPRGVSSESVRGLPPRGVSSECWATRGGRCIPVSASLLGGGARGGGHKQSLSACRRSAWTGAPGGILATSTGCQRRSVRSEAPSAHLPGRPAGSGH